MKLEDQVCSLELAKRLKELGVKQESIFYWIREADPYIWFNSANYSYPMKAVLWHFSAFTLAELGEILRYFELNNKYYEIDYYNTYDHFNMVLKTTKQLNIASWYIEDSTEANARARMIIHLLECNLMEVPK